MREMAEDVSTPPSASLPKPRKKKKEATKSREWERDRRERLNNSFTDLGKLLPTNSNVAPTRKMEILQKASAYIKTLQLENAELLESSSTGKTWSREVKQLQCQVKELTSRNQQLVLLLQDAGGKLPPWVSVPCLGKRELHYSNKFTQEDLERSLAEPKKKRSRKNSQKEKGSDVSSTKKKKTNSKTSSKKSGGSKNSILHKIKPPSVAQLLNVPCTTNNTSSSKLENTPITSSLVILPPEKPPPIDLSNGIIVVKGSNQATSSTNTLSSGLLFMRTPPNSSQPATLAAKPCILLSNTNSGTTTTVQQTPIVVAPSSQQLTPAQTTTLLTTPIMATGHPNSILQTSQTLPSTSNSSGGAPTFVLTNGNLVPVLSSSTITKTPCQGSQPAINLAPKPQKVINKNANKVPIPKLPKKNLKGNKTTIKKKKEIINIPPTSITNITLDSLKSIVTNVGSTNSVAIKDPESVCDSASSAVQTLRVTEVLPVTESDSVVESETLENKKVCVVSNTDIAKTSTEKCVEIPEASKPQQLLSSSQTILNVPQSASVGEVSGKPLGHKSSYSIDSLCKGKQGSSPNFFKSTEIPSDVESSVQNNASKNKVDKDSKKEQSMYDSQSNKHLFDNQTPRIISEQEKEKCVKNVGDLSVQSQTIIESPTKESKQGTNNIETNNEKCMQNSAERFKESKIISSGEKLVEQLAPQVVSESVLTFSDHNEMCNTGPKTFYSNYDNCSTLRNHEFVPAEVSPSGFIGPQPPMATVVDTPLSKEGIEQYPGPQIYRPNVEESCRTEENMDTSENLENQQTEVLSNTMPSTFSSDIFASLNVPSGHPESISPTAAFLLAFPLVSSSTGRTNEMMSEHPETQRSEVCNSSGNSLLQLGSMDEQPSSQAVVELSSLMSQGSRHHHTMLDSHNHNMQNTQNMVQNTHYKNQIKVTPNQTSCAGPSIKHIESPTKQFNSHTMLPPMPHSFQLGEQISDYDAEISSIMSNTNQSHHSLPLQTSQNKNTPNRNVPANSCRSKTNDRVRETQYLQQPNNTTDKQFSSLQMQHSNNTCHQQQICAEQMQQPLYRPCNTTKKQMQPPPQQIPYHNAAVHFSSGQQTDRNSRCNTANYNQQPIFGSSVSNSSLQTQQRKLPVPPLPPPPPRLEPYPQKPLQEQIDTSHFIGKLNTNATTEPKLSTVNVNQRYKIAVTEASTQPSIIKSSVNNNRFDRNMSESLETSRHNFVPAVSSQAYAYNLFNDYPTSNYLPLPSLASSTASSITTEAAHSSLGSFSVAHNSSNFGILSWSTLSPMTAPNTQQVSGYNNNNTSEANCHKQSAPTYQQINENQTSAYPNNGNQNKPSTAPYQQPSNRSAQITYPQQTVKETQPTPRPPVNWMTTPDIRHENVTSHFDHTHQVPCSNAVISQKDMNTTNNTCNNNNNFVNNTVYNDYSENLSHSWQGNKTNTQHQNVSNPLPTLVGDLALGPTPPTSTKYCSGYKPATARKQEKEVNKRGDFNIGTVGSSASFLSVSQLVDHNVKETRGGGSSRRTTRPSTKAGSRRDRNKNQNAQLPVHFNEPTVAVATTYPTVSNWPAPKSSYKATPSNYSAEALIGIPPTQQQELIPPALHSSIDKVNSMERYSQNYPSRSHFPTEHASNYFTEPIETNYQQSSYGANCSSSNYQSSSTNNYMPNTGQTFSGPDITGSSITTPSFTSELGSSNFLFPTTTASTRSGFFPSEITPSNTGKNSSRNNKRRQTEHSDANYQDNSYVAPNQLNQLEYSNTGRSHHTASQQMVPRCNEVPPQNCGPTYHSARGATVQNTTSPGNTTVQPAGGSSLTNFNLSTIFPEINDKTPVPPLPAFVSSKNLSASSSLALGGSGTDYMLHHSNMSFNNLLGHTPSHQVGIGLNQSFPTPSFSNMMPPSLAFSVHDH